MMPEISPDVALAIAAAWHSAGDLWHFHMLPPTCRFNRYCLGACTVLLENPRKRLQFLVCSSDVNKTLGRRLAELAHFEVFDTVSGEGSTSPWLAAWEEFIRSCEERGIAWHHHMLFPECILNNHAPNWVLMLEADGRDLIHVDGKRPIHEFIALERLVWHSAP